MTYADLHALCVASIARGGSRIVVTIPASPSTPRPVLGQRRRIAPGLVGPIVGEGEDGCGRKVVRVELAVATVQRILKRRGVA